MPTGHVRAIIDITLLMCVLRDRANLSDDGEYYNTDAYKWIGESGQSFGSGPFVINNRPFMPATVGFSDIYIFIIYSQDDFWILSGARLLILQ